MAETNIKDVKLKIGTDEQFQSKLKDLPLNTLVGITDPIQEGELDPSIIDKLGKADNSLQKPTSTLAKESFVKVGIDGTQTFDENSYVVAPSTDGTVGQVLKKTETGTEWTNESGGGKLYSHTVDVKSSGIYGVPALKFKFISTSNTPITKDNICTDTYFRMPKAIFDMILSGDDATVPPVTYIATNFLAEPDHVNVSYFKTYPTNSVSNINIGSGGDYSVTDTVTEL